MLGSKDQRQFARIWNKMQDHIDSEKAIAGIGNIDKEETKVLSPVETVIWGMTQANVQGQDITEELLKLQQEYSI